MLLCTVSEIYYGDLKCSIFQAMAALNSHMHVSLPEYFYHLLAFNFQNVKVTLISQKGCIPQKLMDELY